MINFYNIKYPKEDYRSQSLKSFRWSILYKHAGELFNLIHSNSLYIYNISENIGERYMVSLETISKDGAAFESEFDNLNIKVAHNSKTITARDNSKSKITVLKDDKLIKSEERGIYKYLIKQIDHDALEAKIRTAFELYKNCLSLVEHILSYNLTYEQIGTNCMKARNSVDHGNLNFNITAEDANSFILLRCLIIAMQLTKAGFDDIDINMLIEVLYK